MEYIESSRSPVAFSGVMTPVRMSIRIDFSRTSSLLINSPSPEKILYTAFIAQFTSLVEALHNHPVILMMPIVVRSLNSRPNPFKPASSSFAAFSSGVVKVTKLSRKSWILDIV